MKTKTLSLILPLIIAALCIMCRSQGREHKVELQILDRMTQEGMAGIRVSLNKNGEIQRCRADSTGHLSIKGLEAGEYIVYVTDNKDSIIKKIKLDDQYPDSEMVLAFPPLDYYSGTAASCPKCKRSDRAIKIIYGEPSMADLEASYRDEVYLEGCELDDTTRKWYCTRDSLKF